MSGPSPRHPAPLRLAPTSRARQPDRPTFLFAIGGRGDAIRLTPVMRALHRRGDSRLLQVHSGPRDTRDLIESVRTDLGLAEPDFRLDVDAGRGARGTASTLAAFERLLDEVRPDVVALGGASDASFACALAASKQSIAIVRVDAGLRSGVPADVREINRALIDRMADTLLTTTRQDHDNLLREGIPDSRVHLIGNTTVDVLRRCDVRSAPAEPWRAHGLTVGDYVLVALRDPRTFAHERLGPLAAGLTGLASRHPVLLVADPGVRARLDAAGHARALRAAGAQIVGPAGYREFVALQRGAGVVVTDVGSIQDETSVLGTACRTLASWTERSASLSHGTNGLLGDDPSALADVHPRGAERTPAAIPLWDGRAGERAGEVMTAHYVLRTAVGSTASPA